MTNEEQREYEQQVIAAIETRMSNFEQWARDAIAHNRGEQAAFEARLFVRWQSAFDLLELILVEAHDLGATFNERYRPQAIAENDLVFEALVTLHSRSCLLASEVYSLLRSGRPSGALARWRSLHEVLIVSQLIRNNDRDLSERFLLHEHVQRWLAAKYYQTHAVALGEEPLETSYIEDLDRTVKRLCEKYSDPDYACPNGWANKLVQAAPVKKRKRSPSIADLEKLANLEYVRPYYSLASEGVHPDFKGMRRTIYTMGEDIMLSGPTNYGLADAGQWTLWALYFCTAALISIAPTPEEYAMLGIIARLVSKAAESFVKIQKQIEQEEKDKSSPEELNEHKDMQKRGSS